MNLLALNYFAEKVEIEKLKGEYTVCVYDLGGGTFDISITTVYPQGKTNSKGEIYYYDSFCSNGIGNLGGKNFTEKMVELIKKKVADESVKISKRSLIKLIEIAETAKKELSVKNDFDIVSRAEYEKFVFPLVEKTITAVRKELADAKLKNVEPNIIILTGGACRMPIIEKEMKKAFSNIEVVCHEPDKAIAYGAARFGMLE